MPASSFTTKKPISCRVGNNKLKLLHKIQPIRTPLNVKQDGNGDLTGWSLRAIKRQVKLKVLRFLKSYLPNSSLLHATYLKDKRTDQRLNKFIILTSNTKQRKYTKFCFRKYGFKKTQYFCKDDWIHYM